ncbi:MAG: AMP-binding protein [Alphaproteobacteria bacterium]|nr:AMP-binding protein [Alphaproteobacteria bacterium]
MILAEPLSHPTTLGQLLEIGAPQTTAIAAPDRPGLSYGDLRKTVARGAKAIGNIGVGRRDRIVIVLDNGPEAAVGFLAAASAGVACPLNPGLTASEFEFTISDLEARALITAPGPSAARDVADKLEIPILEVVPGDKAGAIELVAINLVANNGNDRDPAEWHKPTSDHEALALHTSGTTARPKLVPLTHGNLCASARNIAASLSLSPADRCLNVMPLFHVHGLVAAMLSTLYAGATIWCAPGFNGLKFFGWMDQAQATWMTAVPTIYQAALGRAPRNADVIARNPFRFMRSSSAAMPTSVLERLEQTFGTAVVESYGMTESAQQICANPLPPAVRKPGTVGLPSGPDVTILDELGATVAGGITGEVAIKGENVTSGYFENPDANAAAFVGPWLRTGDLGGFDADGYLTLVGRAKEIINRGGEKISPAEVEDALLRHPGVTEAAVFALPHPSLGEEPAAAVVMGGAAATTDALRAHVSERLAKFKVPRTIVVVDALPKGPTGKVARLSLAKQLGLTSR